VALKRSYISSEWRNATKRATTGPAYSLSARNSFELFCFGVLSYKSRLAYVRGFCFCDCKRILILYLYFSCLQISCNTLQIVKRTQCTNIGKHAYSCHAQMGLSFLSNCYPNKIRVPNLIMVILGQYPWYQYGKFFFLLDHFLDLFESKWLFEYIIRWNKIYIFW